MSFGVVLYYKEEARLYQTAEDIGFRISSSPLVDIHEFVASPGGTTAS